MKRLPVVFMMFPLPEITTEPRVIEPVDCMEMFPILAVSEILAFAMKRLPVVSIIFPLPEITTEPRVMLPVDCMEIFPILAV